MTESEIMQILRNCAATARACADKIKSKDGEEDAYSEGAADALALLVDSLTDDPEGGE